MNEAVLRALLSPQDPVTRYGIVRGTRGKGFLVAGLVAELGSICAIETATGTSLAQVVGFNEGEQTVMPLESVAGISPGCRVSLQASHSEPSLAELPGRVVDGLGEPMDSLGALTRSRVAPLHAHINPLSRTKIEREFDVGVRAINALLTIGEGQRVGLFAGSGVGKSVLLGMMARYARADVVVVALIGERGREVREFIDDNLGDGLSRAVVVVAPADEPATKRLLAARFATRVAERFRAEGKRVLLLMDSLTRVAQAQREVGLAAGEPPAAKGYPPSVFAEIPNLVERAGCLDGGAITGLYTVLVEEDDMTDPIADTARGVLDGHIVLDRGLAERGVYPAIDVQQSLSRVMNKVVDDRHMLSARVFRRLWGVYAAQQDLITVGAYAPGADVELDKAIEFRPRLETFVSQSSEENVSFEESAAELQALFAPSQGAVQSAPSATSAQEPEG